jgi:hypothetical protein
VPQALLQVYGRLQQGPPVAGNHAPHLAQLLLRALVSLKLHSSST